MIGDKVKSKINIICIIVLIIGALCSWLFSKSTGTVKTDKEIMQEYMKKAQEIKIHCDYCKGYTFNQYQLDVDVPDIYVFKYTKKNGKEIKRYICTYCTILANIKTFDKLLKPKYKKYRPKSYK